MNKLRVGLLTIVFSFILSLGGIFIAHLSDQSIAKRKDKVTICHIPPDNPANYHEINVPENAIPHHLSHGDCPGPCVDSDADGIPDCNDLCPNGIVNPGEECDDGNNNNGDLCRADCTVVICGDGIKDPQEECDDGNVDDNDDCTNGCILPNCGDGNTDPLEQCDDGGESATCDDDCSTVMCGDGKLNQTAGEECDDGNTASGDGCSSDCQLEGGEVGQSCNVDADCQSGVCTAGTCQAASCSDGVQNGDETDVDCGGSCDGCPNEKACASGNDCQSNFCFEEICQSPSCGDGVIDPDEECDDGVNNSDFVPDACRTNCTNPFCGDGVQDTGEECDDGNNETGDGCRGDCTILGCGDGIGDSEVFVTDGVSSFFIDTYEASRPDADSVLPGVAEHRACSSPDKQPWVNVTWTEADDACTAAGKRLCTEEEWQLACEGTAENTFPYGDVYDPMACNGKDYNPNCSGEDVDLALPTGTDYGCPPPGANACESEFDAFDMSGNVSEWTATQATLAPPRYRIRGGSYDTFEGGLTCQFDFVVAPESFHFRNVGFRCCRDPQCSDGIDNDGDLVIDFPADAQCTSAADDDEGA